MNRLFAVLALLLAVPAQAALDVGAPAPDFSTQASLNGKEFTYALAAALKQGPVVLYFYPAAFTKGCSAEARSFATAIPKFKEFGASVIGVSGDSIATLNKFSVSECQGKFPVASDDQQRIMKAYDAVLLWKTGYASRTSYVITPDSRIAYSYTDMNPDLHVENTLAALKDWAAKQKPQ
ncbi:MAG: peroxiredoxin [Rhodocyclales bacterium]|nr:peroxiredoxin [Rhodocyclales bacterium]